MKLAPIDRIGILGAGAWGTALALVLRRAGREVVLWAFEPEVAAAINEHRENTLFLPGIALDPGIRATTEIEAVAEAETLLLAVPAQHMRAIAGRLAQHEIAGRPLVICSKGIEQRSGALMSEVIAEVLPEAPCAVLSGPSLAPEVARGLPTAVTLATTDGELGARLVRAIGGSRFRPYLSGDPTGAEIGGAVKNVIALACGIVAGRGLGDNASAALVTRGLAEITRLGLAKDAKAETFMGLSGLGDLALTCNSSQSRNFSLGLALGAGRRLEDILAERRSIAEGVTTAPSVLALARRLGVEMPISAAVDAVLHRGAAIDATVEELLARPFKTEAVKRRTLA